MTAVCLGVPTSRFERKLVEKIVKVQKDDDATTTVDQHPPGLTPVAANRLYQMDFGAAQASGAFPVPTSHTTSATRGAAALLDIFDRSIVRQKHSYFAAKHGFAGEPPLAPSNPRAHVPRYDRSLRLGKGTFGEVVLAEDTHQTAININETLAIRQQQQQQSAGGIEGLNDEGLHAASADSIVGEELEAHREFVAIKTLKKDVINNMVRISAKLTSATTSPTPTDPSSLILCLSGSPPLIPSTSPTSSTGIPTSSSGAGGSPIVTNTKQAAVVLRVPNTRRFDYASTNSVTFKNIKKQLVGMRGTVVNELKMMQLSAHPCIISLLDVRLRIFTTDAAAPSTDGKAAVPEPHKSSTSSSSSRRQKEVIAPPPKDSVQLDFVFPLLTADLSELCKSNALQVKNAIIIGREASRDAGAFKTAKGESVERIQTWIHTRTPAPQEYDLLGTPKGKRSRSPNTSNLGSGGGGAFAEQDSSCSGVVSAEEEFNSGSNSGEGKAEKERSNDEDEMRSLYGSCIALQNILQPQNVSIRGNTTTNNNPPIVAGATKSPDAPAASSSAYLSADCAITMRQLHYLFQESFRIDRHKVLRRLTEIVAKDLSAALDHLHNRRVIHRDLKSNNVLLAWRGPKATGKWVVQLVDFGWTRTALSTDENQINNKHLQYDLEEAVCLATVAVDGAEASTAAATVEMDAGTQRATRTILSPLNSLTAILNSRASDAPIRPGHPFYGLSSSDQQSTLRMLVSHVARQSYLNALRWRATQIAQWSAACGATDLTGPCCNNRYKAPELLASNVERTRPSRTLQRHFDRSIVVEWGLCSLAEHGSAIIHSDLIQAAESPSVIANNLRYLKDFIAKARRLCTHTQSTIPPLVVTHTDRVSEPSLPTTTTTTQMVCGLPPAAAEHLAAPDLLDRIRKKSEPYYPFLAAFLEGDPTAVAQQLAADPNDQGALALNNKLKRVVELSTNAWTSVINKRDTGRGGDKANKRRLGEDPLSDNDSEEDEEDDSLDESDDLESMRRTSDDVETAINECNFNKTTVYGQGHYYSTKIDMWSLGCVLLDVVTSCGSSLQRLEHTVFGIYGDNFKHCVTGTYDTKFLQQMGGSRSTIQRRFASAQQQQVGAGKQAGGAAFGIVSMWNSMSGATAMSPHAHDEISENERVSLTNALAKRYNNTAGYCDGAGSLGTHTTTVSEYDDSLSDFDDSEGGGGKAAGAANPAAPKKKPGKPGNNDSGQKYKQHPSVFRFALNAVGIPRSYIEEAIACIFSINFAVPTIPADLTELMPLHQEDHVRHAYQDPPISTSATAEGSTTTTHATGTAVVIPAISTGSPVGRQGTSLAPPVASINATRQHFMASSSIVNPWSVVPLANERCQRTATRFIKSLAYDILTAIIHHCGTQAHELSEGEISLDEQMLRYVRQLKKVFLSDPPAAVAHVRQLLKNVATEYNRRQSLAHVRKHLAGVHASQVSATSSSRRSASPPTESGMGGPTVAASVDALSNSLSLLDHYAPHDAAVLYVAPNLLHSSPLWLSGGYFDAINCASPAPGRLPGLSHRDRYLNASTSPYTHQLIKSNSTQLEWTKTNHNDGLLDSVEQFIQCGQHKHLSYNKVFLRGAQPPAQSTTMTAIIAQAQAHASPRTLSTPTSPNASASTPVPPNSPPGLAMPSLVYGESLIKHIITGEAALHVTAAPSFGVAYVEGQCASTSLVPDNSSYATKVSVVEDRVRHETLLFGLFSGLLAFDPQERASAADALRSISRVGKKPVDDRLAFTDIVQLAGGRHLVMKMGK